MILPPIPLWTYVSSSISFSKDFTPPQVLLLPLFFMASWAKAILFSLTSDFPTVDGKCRAAGHQWKCVCACVCLMRFVNETYSIHWVFPWVCGMFCRVQLLHSPDLSNSWPFNCKLFPSLTTGYAKPAFGALAACSLTLPPALKFLWTFQHFKVILPVFLLMRLQCVCVWISKEKSSSYWFLCEDHWLLTVRYSHPRLDLWNHQPCAAQVLRVPQFNS